MLKYIKIILLSFTIFVIAQLEANSNACVFNCKNDDEEITTSKEKIQSENNNLLSSNKKSAIQKIIYTSEGLGEIDYDEYMKSISEPKILASQDGQTILTIKSSDDIEIEEYRLWKIEIEEKNAELKLFGSFQVNKQEFKLKPFSSFFVKGDYKNLPFRSNGIYYGTEFLNKNIKSNVMGLESVALSSDGSKIAFAFRNNSRTEIDVGIFDTQTGNREKLIKIPLDEHVQSIFFDFPLICGIAFRPENENELILCHGGIYEKHDMPLTFSLASIDINQGIIQKRGQLEDNQTIDLLTSLGIYPQGPMRVSSDGKFIFLSGRLYCHTEVDGHWHMEEGVYNSISFSGDKIDQLCTNSKHHFQLIFRSQDLNIAEISSNRIFLSDITDKTDDIDLSSKATGCALAKVSIKNSNDCLRYPKEQIKKFERKIEKSTEQLRPNYVESLRNGYTITVLGGDKSSYAYSLKEPQRFNSFSKEHFIQFPSQFYDFQKIKNNSLSVATLSNDGNLLLFYNNSRNASFPFIFSMNEDTLIPIKVLNFNSFTNVVPVEDSDFVLLGKTAEYISIKDVEASVNLSLKQKKAIDLIEVGFEEEGINLLLKSYEGKDKWNKAPYMTLGSLFVNILCFEIYCDYKKNHKLSIETLSLINGKLQVQRIKALSEAKTEETKDEQAKRLSRLTFAYNLYTMIASYLGHFGLAEQGLEAIQSLIDNPDNTKLGFKPIHFAGIELMRANIVAQSDLNKAYSSLLEKDNLKAAFDYKHIGWLELAQTLKKDRKKFCFLLDLSEKDCKHKALDLRDYKNLNYVDLDGNLIKGITEIKSQTSSLEQPEAKSQNKENSNASVTILD